MNLNEHNLYARAEEGVYSEDGEKLNTKNIRKKRKPLSSYLSKDKKV